VDLNAVVFGKINKTN